MQIMVQEVYVCMLIYNCNKRLLFTFILHINRIYVLYIFLV